MNKKIELLKEAVSCYKVNHINGDKNEKLLLDYINELEQLTLTDVGWSEVFIKYGKPFTSGRDLWDWLKDNCKVVLKT